MLNAIWELFLLFLLGIFIIIPVFWNIYRENLYKYIKDREKEEKKRRKKWRLFYMWLKELASSILANRTKRGDKFDNIRARCCD